jgi:hypothetical protein
MVAGDNPPNGRSPVDPAHVHEQLARILARSEFQSADRLSRLLQYLVLNALEGPGKTVMPI